MKKIESFSTGGLGDFFIVFLKLLDEVRDGSFVEHIHIESNEVVPKIINEEFSTLIPINLVGGMSLNSFCDKDYIQKINKGGMKGVRPFNTSWHGKYNFPKEDEGLKTPFLYDSNAYNKHYDVCIQVSSGANNTKGWKFDPLALQKILQKKGYKVCLIGTDEKFFRENDPCNFVCKSSFAVACSIVNVSKVFVGISGFFTYYACANKVFNVHHPDTRESVEHYIHPAWLNYRYDSFYGSLKETLGGIDFLMKKT